LAGKDADPTPPDAILEGHRVMTERVGPKVETLTILILIRLQRRGGLKLIMAPAGRCCLSGSRRETRH
jgi:hypothetical protein